MSNADLKELYDWCIAVKNGTTETTAVKPVVVTTDTVIELIEEIFSLRG